MRAVVSHAMEGLPPARRGVALERLAELGRVVEERERGAWDRSTYRANAAADAAVAGLWTRWSQAAPFADQAAWLELLSRPVQRSFRQALSGRPLPSDVVRRALRDLEEALFYQLLDGRDQPGGLSEIAVGVIEGAPGGPIPALMSVLDERRRAVVAACVCRRGHWPDTVARVLSDLPGPGERALHLRQPEHTERASAWLDLHVVLRLLCSWEESDPEERRDRGIVVQNRGRARGRLRAVAVRRAPAELLPHLLSLDALADRTRAAAARWAWSWAWEALSTGFAFDVGQPVLRPCVADEGLEPLEAEDLEVLQVWAMLVMLRGRWATLIHWSQTGTGDSDGTWGRLLGELPLDLRDPGGGLSRVRAALARDAQRVDEWLRPVAEELGGLAEGRKLKAAFWDVLNPVWHDAVRRPESGYPTMRRNAIEWLQASESDGAVPPGRPESPS